jgi:bZIP transcription factor
LLVFTPGASSAMLSTVAPPPPPMSSTLMMDQPSPSDARKHRRELLALQRTVSTSPCTFVTCNNDAPSSAHESSASRKPQMKYDPDVPMTKEEAAIWRREQRRQRNRLSAAQSREKQRHRIVELESELDEWKGKYAAVQAKIDSLLAQKTSTVTDDEARATSPIPSTVASKSIVSPSASPTSCVSMVVLEPSQDEKFDLIMSLSDDDLESAACNTSFLKPLKMISRLAMSSITINS